MGLLDAYKCPVCEFVFPNTPPPVGDDSIVDPRVSQLTVRERLAAGVASPRGVGVVPGRREGHDDHKASRGAGANQAPPAHDQKEWMCGSCEWQLDSQTTLFVQQGHRGVHPPKPFHAPYQWVFEVRQRAHVCMCACVHVCMCACVLSRRARGVVDWQRVALWAKP